jgi:hypothetical protein
MVRWRSVHGGSGPPFSRSTHLSPRSTQAPQRWPPKRSTPTQFSGHPPTGLWSRVLSSPTGFSWILLSVFLNLSISQSLLSSHPLVLTLLLEQKEDKRVIKKKKRGVRVCLKRDAYLYKCEKAWAASWRALWCRGESQGRWWQGTASSMRWMLRCLVNLQI